MNAITTFTPSAKALAMVITARQDAGATNPVSEGAVCLAEFLADRSAHPLIDFLGGWGGAARLMADGYMPGNDIGEEMGRLSGGVLTPQLWRRPWGGELEIAVQEAEAEALRYPAAVSPERSGALSSPVPSLGALGTVPPGRLFAFRPVEDEPNLRQIAGLGIAFELSEAGLASLRDAASAAIADVRGDAQA